MIFLEEGLIFNELGVVPHWEGLKIRAKFFIVSAIPLACVMEPKEHHVCH